MDDIKHLANDGRHLTDAEQCQGDASTLAQLPASLFSESNQRCFCPTCKTRKETTMIVVVECRDDVGGAYVSGLGREGIASTQFTPPDAVDWFKSAANGDLAAVQGVLLGDGGHHPTVVKGVRGACCKPIIALCDRRSVEDTLNLFELGVDDVVAKPVHVREILARVNRIGSRRPVDETRYASSDVVVYADGRDPMVAGEPLPLPRRERRILECLAEARGAWISKQQLFSKVYGVFNDDISETVIESHVSRLRRRMRERVGRDVVEAQRHLGYRILRGRS